MADPIHSFLERAQNTVALVVGDVMIDTYLKGRVERISPEAPVPVVQVLERSARLGGAANVALNMKAFGSDPLVISIVGDDEHANTLERLFREQGLRPSGLIRSPKRRTTMKTRVISGHQHIVRVDEEQEDELAVVDEDRLVERVHQAIRNEKVNVLVFEDYDKGVLTTKVITEIIAAAKKAGIPIAVDPKKRNFFAYRGVDLFKPNLKELREGLKIELDPSDRNGLRKSVSQLEASLGNNASLITMSEHGAYIHQGDQEHHEAAHHRKISDVSGAGDTVIAVAALALAQSLPISRIAQLANLAGGLVCEEVGVVPIDVARFRGEHERLFPAK